MIITHDLLHWHVVIHERTDEGVVPFDHFLTKLDDLYATIARVPLAMIEHVEVFRVTIEQ